MRFRSCGRLVVLLVLSLIGLRVYAADQVVVSVFQTPLKAEDLDPAAFSQWVDGAVKPLDVSDGPRHVIWTSDSAAQWDGVTFSDSKKAGERHMRIGWKRPLTVGSVLARCGGELSVLKAGVAYPGDMADETQWVPAQRILDRQISSKEPWSEEYAMWILPPGTVTRALRFTHTAAPTDKSYAGWLGGVYVLSGRFSNAAPQAIAVTSASNDAAGRVNNGSNDGTWGAWDNGSTAGMEKTATVISKEHAEWVMLVWPQPVQLRGLNAVWAGFEACEAQAYTGLADQHPREAADSDWKTIKNFDKLENQYPRSLGVNWLDFGKVVTTRAVRLRLTHATQESHPHLQGKTVGGKRVWLGELLALQPLGSGDLSMAVLPAAPTADLGHPPIAVRFTTKEAGLVTLVIEDSAGQRVRNLVSETPFPAGDNVVWWDGMDDLGRDTEAAKHGIYNTPGQFVRPGAYHVRGLFRKGIDLRYEMSVYNAGNPAWETADHTGGWLTNHTPPQATLFVPANKTPNHKAMVYLGSAVAEGGDGLAWVDLDGRKQGGQGHVGGAWTGAPCLARDAGKNAVADTFAYVGSTWEGDLRLTALSKQGEKQVVKYTFADKQSAKDTLALISLAVHDGLVVCSLPKHQQLLLVDAAAGKVLGAANVPDPRGVAFDAQGRLLVLSGKQLQRYAIAAGAAAVNLPKPEVVVTEGLEDPRQVAMDTQGNFYISDRGNSHQVKVYSPDGKSVRSIGHAGIPKAGPYDPLHMNNPEGVSIDERQQLWVAEMDYQPKRVSVWTLDGTLLKAFYGPSEYGGGGKLDPLDKTRFYYHGMEFKLDWEKGTNQLVSVFFRPGPGEMQLGWNWGQPETPIYIKGQRYFTNCYNSNPTNGASVAMLWLDRDGIAVPVAALGRANDWDLLKTDALKSVWPKDVNLKGDYWQNQALVVWSDLNGDGKAQPDELTMVKAGIGGVTVMTDLSFVESRWNEVTTRYAPQKFTAQGVPVYTLSSAQKIVEGSQGPTTSGGDQALLTPNGWTILTVAPKPYSAWSVGGALNGKPMWCYPDMWPGLHASHESAPPDHPGELVGTTRLLGDVVTPRNSDAGPIWAINGNMGNMYLMTTDGLFVATLFADSRQGPTWSMPIAERNMLLNRLTANDENFWPSITQTTDGNVYLVDGDRTSLVRVDGLESIKRIPEMPLAISDADLKSAQAYFLQREATRQKSLGQETMKVAMLGSAPAVDGKLDEWTDAKWVTVDKRGVGAWFDSNSKPYNVTAAAAITGDRLYVAYRTADKELLRNSGEMATAPFKTGGALDLMIGTNPKADPKRSNPVEGDIRLLVTIAKDKPLALVYRAVVPGTREPVPFSSPWRTITLDRVDNVSDQVQLAGADGNYELSIPLAVLGLKPAAGQSIKADIGLLRGNGFQTLQRVYWSNKATGLTSDVPSEAMLTPQLWGTWEFGGR